MFIRRLRLITFVVLAAGVAGNCAAHDRAVGTSVVDVHFTAAEIEVIRDYYETASAGQGKGKGGNGLPPGIAKNLARGKPLPPGIAKQYLPVDLVRRLPPVPDGYERIIVAGKILLVEIATQVIRDVLTDVLFV